jgi:hypothetical protein
MEQHDMTTFQALTEAQTILAGVGIMAFATFVFAALSWK